MNAHATVAPSRRVLLLAALAIAACTSIPGGSDWKGQRRYGTYMARRGFWREALFRFEKAAALRPEDGETQNNLAVAYESIGETAKALEAYKRALALDPQNQQIKRNYARFAEYYTSVQRASGGAAPAIAPAVAPTPALGAPTPTAATGSPTPTPAPAPTAIPPTSQPTAPAPTPAPPAVPPTPVPGVPTPTPPPEPVVPSTPTPAPSAPATGGAR